MNTVPHKSDRILSKSKIMKYLKTTKLIKNYLCCCNKSFPSLSLYVMSFSEKNNKLDP